MRRIVKGPLLVLLAGIVLTGHLRASDLEPWNYQGTFSGKGDYFTNQGNPAISPYRFEDAQILGNLDMSFDRTFSPYETVRGQLSGRLNRSDYVRDYKGAILDRFTTTWEKGDARVPFRLTAGDYFAFFTPRTVQRSLKGLQYELQPVVRGGHRQSFVLFTGSAIPSFREVDYNDDVSSGFSFMVDEGERGAISFNFVNNHQDSAVGTGSVDQWLSSVAVRRKETLWGQNLRLELEGSVFDGDPLKANAVPDTAGNGFFLRLLGDNGGPLSYSYQKERFDDDFRPTGAPVVADRAADFLRASYRFQSGLRMEARHLAEETGFASGNPLERITRGVNFNGPFLRQWLPRARFTLDSFRQRLRSRTLQSDSESRVHNLGISTPTGVWTMNFSQTYQDVDDHVNVASDLVERNSRLSGTRSMRLGDYRGSLNLGVNYRRQHALPASRDWGASVAANLNDGPRSLSFSLANFDQRRFALPSRDTVTRDYKLRYGIRWGDQQVSFETGWQERHENLQADNTAFNLGILYSVRFGSRSHRLPRPAVPEAPRPTPTSESRTESTPREPGKTKVAADSFRIASLLPGMTMTEARVTLARAGITGRIDQAGVEVYEARFYDRFSERQRLFLEEEGGRLKRAGVLVDLGGAGSPMDEEEQLERTLTMLAERYGPPETTVEQGDILATLQQDVDDGRLVRVYEWRTGEGRLRLGIPRRLDGQVRLEIHHARTHRPLRDPNWSLEQLP